MAFFPVAGMQSQAFRSGGQRKFALPDTGIDPTDADVGRASRTRRRELSGERRLVLAVFMAVLDDLGRYPLASKEYAAAWRWCFLNDDECWPLAFRPACATLELDPEAVRARLHATVAAHPPAPVERPRHVGGRPRSTSPVLLCRAAS